VSVCLRVSTEAITTRETTLRQIQGGKASLDNTEDTNILENILAKLVVRIASKARTFLVKIKAHRGEPLNEEADDL
jgi:hypothetical protein